MDLVDTHCHLSFSPLVEDLDGVLERAHTAGVGAVVTPAYDRRSWEVISGLCRRPGVYGAYGLHPWCSDEVLDLDELKTRLGGDRAVAVGEIGLDHTIDGAGGDRQRQLEIFESQLELAVALDLPVILHCRGAFEEMAAVLARCVPRVRGVVHAFSRGPELALRFVELGLHIAFGGAVTRPRAVRARRSAVSVSIDRVVLETDAPAIGVEGVAGEACEPRHVRDVACALAALRGEDVEVIARRTTDTARRLFGM